MGRDGPLEERNEWGAPGPAEGVSATPAGLASQARPGGGPRRGRWKRAGGSTRGAAPLSGVIFHLGRLIFVPGEDNE